MPPTLRPRRRITEAGSARSLRHSRPDSKSLVTRQRARKRPCSRLCSRCRKLNLPALFNGQAQRDGTIPSPLPKTGHPIHIFEDDESCRSKTCAVCHLFYSVSSSRPSWLEGEQKSHLRLIDAAEAFDHAGVDCSNTAVLLALFPCNPEWITKTGYYFFRLLTQRVHGFITARISRPIAPSTEDGESPEPGLEVRFVDPERVDYCRLKGWLLDCDSNHECDCDPDVMDWEQLEFPLRFIDCGTREIVEPTPSCSIRYFALSYVWGTQPSNRNEHMPKHPHILPSSGVVPKVIEDAITFVLEMGERYLWVDQYCIDQEDADIKKGQIRHMDKIYACAYATIVASAGLDASYGLRGVGTTRRVSHPPAVTSRGDVELYSSLPSRQQAVNASKWSTRGWTYQEAILSSRCFFFTDHQVYFACATKESCEAVTHPYKALPPHEEHLNWSGIQYPTRSLLEPAGVWHSSRLIYHIYQYCGRELSYEEDRLDAFRGLLSRSGFHSYYGVPFFPWTASGLMETPEDFNLAFARGLFWQHPDERSARDSHYKRQYSIPSWSWACWGVRVSYSSLTIECGESVDEIKCDTNFMIECDDDGKDGENPYSTFSSVTGPHSRNNNTFPELSPYLVIEAKVFRFRFNFDGKYVCSCHPNSIHPNKVTFTFEQQLAIPSFHFPGPVSGIENRDRVCNASWDCVLLFDMSVRSEAGLWTALQLLIVEWDQGVAYRVGSLEARASHDTLAQLPWTRRRIRLR